MEKFLSSIIPYLAVIASAFLGSLLSIAEVRINKIWKIILIAISLTVLFMLAYFTSKNTEFIKESLAFISDKVIPLEYNLHPQKDFTRASETLKGLMPQSETPPYDYHAECGLSYSQSIEYSKKAFHGLGQQDSVSIVAALYNQTKGDTEYFPMAIAERGDELFYRVKITNNTNMALETNNVRITLPSSLQYGNDFSRVLYVEGGKEKRMALNDAIVGNGSSVPLKISPKDFVYVMYKVKVAKDAVCGIYAAGTQFFVTL